MIKAIALKKEADRSRRRIARSKRNELLREKKNEIKKLEQELLFTSFRGQYQLHVYTKPIDSEVGIYLDFRKHVIALWSYLSEMGYTVMPDPAYGGFVIHWGEILDKKKFER